MPDHSQREIPVLDDIISSPVKTDELLADANISDEPEIQTNVQLDIQLDTLNEPVLTPEPHHTHAYDEINDTPHKLINPEQGNNDHSGTRIEPTLHHAEAAETLEPQTDAATENTGSTSNAILSTTDDALSHTVENDPPPQQQTPNEEYTDPEVSPSGERLYRYIPEATVDVETQNTIAPIHADTPIASPIDAPEINTLPQDADTTASEHQAAENEQFEPPHSNEASTDANHEDEDGHHSIGNEPVLKTDTDITHCEFSDNRDDENEQDSEPLQTNHSSDTLPKNDDAEMSASTPPIDIAEHESALIDYQTDVDPYAIDEAGTEDDTPTTDTGSDDTPQWHDIQQEIRGIQAETNAAATDTLPLPTLHNLDTDALTEQVLQNIMPNIEQQLRLHVKQAIQDALNTSVKKTGLSDNHQESHQEDATKPEADAH